MFSEVARPAPNEKVEVKIPTTTGGEITFGIPIYLRPKISGYFFTLRLSLPYFRPINVPAEAEKRAYIIVKRRQKFGTLADVLADGRRPNSREEQPQGAYRVFTEHVRAQAEPLMFWVFLDAHGNRVVFEDPGKWSSTYQWEHGFVEGYEITGGVSKENGRDFVEIDRALTNFIDSLIQH